MSYNNKKRFGRPASLELDETSVQRDELDASILFSKRNFNISIRNKVCIYGRASLFFFFFSTYSANLINHGSRGLRGLKSRSLGKRNRFENRARRGTIPWISFALTRINSFRKQTTIRSFLSPLIEIV